MRRHDFQNAARWFRAGRLSLNEFTDQVLGPETVTAANDQPSPTAQTPQSTDHLPMAVALSDTEQPADGNWITPQACRLPALPIDAHKGDCGRIFVVAGSRTMPGAAALVGISALRSGAGLVTVATPASVQLTVAGFSPCLMTYPLPEQNGQLAVEAMNEILAWCDQVDVIALGPGLGVQAATAQIVARIFQRAKAKVVVDADGLNSLAQANVVWSDHAGPRILTPHPGEFGRICQAWKRSDRSVVTTDIADVRQREAMEALAIQFAKKNSLTVVLKGAGTLVTDGDIAWRNRTGNPGMATAGSGDVLTGMIAAIWARQPSPHIAAAAAVWTHGTAGDLAARQGSSTSLMATDLIDCLPAAFAALASAS